MSEALQVLLKALGIVLVGRIAAGSAGTQGKAALASGVEFAVKAECCSRRCRCCRACSPLYRKF